MTPMTAEIAAILRAPFPKEQIGKLPRITCPKCRDSRTKNCDEHRRSKCRECDNYITEKHIHLDYIGHAPTTDRLLQADPAWTWEPMAFGTDGLPALDPNGGLWIRLTVAGVTRIGYGDAQGKKGPDAVKEAIGDAIRNASMRFGVALDLWSKTPLDDQDNPAIGSGQPPAQRNGQTKPSPSEIETAKERLRYSCKENGWDLGIVADLFKQEKGVELKDVTDPKTVESFRESLFSVPSEKLKAAAK